MASGRHRVSSAEADDENSEGEGRGKKRRRRGSGLINYQEGEEDRSRISAQVKLTGKAMRMRAQGKTMASDEEVQFDEGNLATDVKLEPDGNLVLDGVSLSCLELLCEEPFFLQEVLARIRKLKKGEETEFHGSMKLGWVQICPFCNQEVRLKLWLMFFYFCVLGGNFG